MNIYVSNLGFNTQDDGLRKLFASYGEVTSAKIITDRESGQSRGFGFVEMPDDAAAKTAIAALNSSTVGDRTISVSEARPREERQSNSFGGGGYEKRRTNNRW